MPKRTATSKVLRDVSGMPAPRKKSRHAGRPRGTPAQIAKYGAAAVSPQRVREFLKKVQF